MQKLIFLVNPSSGSHNGGNISNQLEHYCQIHNIAYQTYTSQSREHLYELVHNIHQAYQPHQKVIVVGGDGTLHHVIQTLEQFNSAIPIGFIASGTGNDFSGSTWGNLLPLDMLATIISLKEPCQIPILKSQSHCAVNSFGIGFDAQVCELVEKSTLKQTLNRLKIGFLTYPLLILRALKTFKTFSITINQQEFHNVVMATFLNNSRFGGGIQLDPTVQLRHPQANTIIIHDVSFIKICTLLWQLTRQRHLNHPCVKQLHAQEYVIIYPNTIATQADGEVNQLEQSPVTLQLAQRLFWLPK